MLEVDPQNWQPGDSADTLVTPVGCVGVRLNPAVTPWKFEVVNTSHPLRKFSHAFREHVTMKSFDDTPIGEFIGPSAEENALRLCAMLRLCDGVGTDVLNGLRGKLSEILDTPRFPAAKTELLEGDGG